MSIFIFVIVGFLVLIGIGVFALYFTGNTYLLKGIRIVYLKGHTGTYINDWSEFDNRLIRAANPEERSAGKWKLHKEYNKAKPTERLNRINQKMGTVAFLIFKEDQIWYEDYAAAYGTTSKTNSFSMAKSITTALLGKAIEEGFIKSLSQPVTDFFAECPADLTVGDLASMASGMQWNEDYDNPFSSVAKLYLVDDVKKYMLHQRYKEPPGTRFEYNSGNTQLLGMIIEKSVGQNLSDYLSKHFWQPMQMQEDALWELDSQSGNMEKCFCCIASNARDFARFGKLFKDGGRWNGKQLLNEEFVEKCIRPRFKESPEYGYGFWLSDYKEKNSFVMQGILGQYVIVIPEDELMIVRLGHKQDLYKDSHAFRQDFFGYIDEVYQMMGENS